MPYTSVGISLISCQNEAKLVLIAFLQEYKVTMAFLLIYFTALAKQAQLEAALEEGIPLEQLIKPKRGRRKRKVEPLNVDGFNLSMKDQMLTMNDEPPLKITPHPIKLASLESLENAGDLKVSVAALAEMC